MNFPLTSPGDAVAARAGWEASLAGVARREVRRYLSVVERAALDADPSVAVVTAGVGDRFGWFSVVAPWGAAAYELTRHVAALMGDRAPFSPYREDAPYVSPVPDSQYLSSVYGRLMDDTVPRMALDTATLVLAAAAALAWSRARVARELAAVLDPVRGSVLRSRPGPPPVPPYGLPELVEPTVGWAAVPEILARQEATSAYNTYAVRELARAGFTHKRWLTRRDERVRPTHAEADGQTVPLGADFLVGGYALACPADHTGPSAETAGCRCVIVGRT